MTTETDGPGPHLPEPHFEDDGLTIYRFASGPYDNNAYLIVCPRTNQSIVIDTPAEATELVAAARRTDVQAILITHGHFDHTLGYKEITTALNADTGIGEADAPDLPSPPKILIADGDVFTVGRLKLKAIATPGHTPGSTCFLVNRHLFSGDTLFPGGPGKSGSPEAFKQIVESISTRLFALDNRTTFYPGHGAEGSLQTAKDEYVAFVVRERVEGLHGDVTWLGG